MSTKLQGGIETVGSDDWQSTETQIWKPQEKGETLQGFLYTKSPKVKDRSAFYRIQDGNNQLHLVWGSATLDRGMERVEEGQEVRITYNGTRDIGKKFPLKLFEVVYRDSPNDQIKITEEMAGVLDDE